MDAALRRAVRAVADGAELRGPPLPADDMALAVEVGELTPGEVAAAVAGGHGGHEAVVNQLVATAGIDADSKDEDGRTPLSWAAGIG